MNELIPSSLVELEKIWTNNPVIIERSKKEGEIHFYEVGEKLIDGSLREFGLPSYILSYQDEKEETSENFKLIVLNKLSIYVVPMVENKHAVERDVLWELSNLGCKVIMKCVYQGNNNLVGLCGWM